MDEKCIYCKGKGRIMVEDQEGCIYCEGTGIKTTRVNDELCPYCDGTGIKSKKPKKKGEKNED